MESEIEHAELMCLICNTETEHEITYAGRLMVEVQCLTCGNDIHVRRDSLPDDYLDDLRQRFATKPHRLLNRFRRDPVQFFRTLPNAVLRQPRKLWIEYKTVRRENRRNI